MVKIFIGNLASDTTSKELRDLFEEYGEVSECDIVKNFGFVHMNNLSEAEEAIKNLHQRELNGWRMNVEMSKGRPKFTAKLHVSNLGEDVTSEELRAKFEEFGPVVECDIVRNYAFVHMERMEDATNAIDKLDNTAFKGKLINVRLSTSRLRPAPGMGDHNGCFVCGKRGHWSKDCPVGRDASYGPRTCSVRGPPHGMAAPPPPPPPDYSVYSRASYSGGFPPPPPPPPPRRISGYGPELGAYASPAADRSFVYDRERLYSAYYYEKYRAQPYGSSYFEQRRLPYLPPPPAPPSSSSLPKVSSSVDPYERRPLPPASSAAAYYARDHSPIRRVAAVPAPAYSYERKRLSPVPSSTGSYGALRPKESYAQRYAPY